MNSDWFIVVDSPLALFRFLDLFGSLRSDAETIACNLRAVDGKAKNYDDGCGDNNEYRL